MNLPNEIYTLSDITHLTTFLATLPAAELRQALWQEYDTLFDYKNIQEWNKLVRICEALAITGWGEREPVEAFASKWLNGAYYTYIQDRYFDNKSVKSWSKMKDTYVLYEPDADKTDYGISQLRSQQNPLARSPLRFTTIISNKQSSVVPFWESILRLQQTLNKTLRPQLYGRSFSYILFVLHFSNHDDEHTTVQHEYFHDEADAVKNRSYKYYIRPRLKTGKLAMAKQELRLSFDRYYTRAFGELPLEAQKQVMVTELTEVIDILAEKLKKKKIAYDVALFREDVANIVKEWVAAGAS
ncbi:hypothetical protein [Chitinophaga nivalis]|uniref:Nucleotidyltransferase n=1 Tax=Chitinophaga nivalis TaxID=2991709 RepID=A0ABT3IIU7_9BACT|nr:hypothetical protein [Chitinophaga nivalis]MCW3466416.1 hypothetical protein [Chitinophaga nivalis]MCW3483893.1 hypothetical protein [Chitinophaga nivalis]